MPPPLRKSKECGRCGLQRPLEDECPHCAGLSDTELMHLRARLEEEMKSSQNLGWLFMFVAALIFAGLYLMS